MPPSLKPFWENLYENLTESLIAIPKQGINIIQRSERAILIVQEYVQSLKEKVDAYAFIDKVQEILFYKEIKPAFHSLLIYHKKVFQIALAMPPGGIIEKDSYLKLELHRLKEFFEDNKFMYQYLRSGATYLDDKLFFRPSNGSAFAFRMYSLKDLPPFPTSFDLLVAQVKANEMLQEYLNREYEKLHHPDQIDTYIKSSLIWTESKTALIELAYGLQSVGAINDGKVELKEIIDMLQVVFQIDLGHYPRTFQEILSRKTGYTNFIDKLRDKLLLRIKTIEDKHIR